MSQTRVSLVPIFLLFVCLFHTSFSQIIALPNLDDNILAPSFIGKLVKPNPIQQPIIPKPIPKPIPEPGPFIALPIKPIIPVLTQFFINQNSAQTYKGVTEINVPNGDSNSAQYYITFSKYTNNCSHANCYYGWIDNYTIEGSETVKGYPSDEEVQPVFEFKTNSKNDFVIVRHPDLSDTFVNAIEVGCQLYEPTIRNVSREATPTSPKISSGDGSSTFRAKAFAFSRSSPVDEQIEYDFIPSADFQRLQLKSTFNINLDLLANINQDLTPANPILVNPNINPIKISPNIFSTNFASIASNKISAQIPTTIKPSLKVASLSLAQPDINNLKINPNIKLNLNPDIRIASIQRQLPISDLRTNLNQLRQKISIDKDYSILQRSKIIDLNIPSDSFTDNASKPDFISNIKVQFNRVGNQSINHIKLKNYIDELKKKQEKAFEFDTKNIYARRLDINKIKLYNDDFKIIDKLDILPTIFKLNDTKVQNTEASVSACSPIIKPIFTDKVPFIKIKELDPQLRIPIKLNSDLTRPVLPKRRMLLQTNVFTYQKLLFQKQILGKKFQVSIKVDATLIDNKSIRFKGVVTYTLFGQTKTVQAFNYVKDISFTWSKNYDINGKWSFSIYIPLPPPVSFLGINFSFTVSFSLNVDLYAKGYPQIKQCVYKFDVGATVGTEVGVDASAAIRAIAIEGGVFIGGTLVRLSTDPKLSLALNIKSKALTTSVVWYFYIKAFSFEWGFFYRYWRLFKGWSDRKIIKKWPVSNGITKSYLIYKTP